MNKNQKGFGVVELFILIVVIAIAGFGGYWIAHNHHKNASPESFNTCKDIAGSIIQQTSPEVCVTKNGQSFTQSPNYDATVCDAKFHDDLITGATGTFVSYDPQVNQISYKVSNSGQIISNGWCTTPKVEDGNKNILKLSDLKAGDSVTLTIAWDGIELIQVK